MKKKWIIRMKKINQVNEKNESSEWKKWIGWVKKMNQVNEKNKSSEKNESSEWKKWIKWMKKMNQVSEKKWIQESSEWKKGIKSKKKFHQKNRPVCGCSGLQRRPPVSFASNGCRTRSVRHTRKMFPERRQISTAWNKTATAEPLYEVLGHTERTES